MAASLSKKSKGDIIEGTQLGVLGFVLEELHLAPEDRGIKDSTILVRHVELLLLTSTSAKEFLAERDVGPGHGVVLSDG